MIHIQRTSVWVSLPPSWSGRINPSDFAWYRMTVGCWITWLLLLLLLISSAWRWRDEIHDENSLSRPSASHTVLLGSNPRLSALIWQPAGGAAGSEGPPKFVNSGGWNICSPEGRGSDRNLLVIRDGKFNLVWRKRQRERGRASEPQWVLESQSGSFLSLLYFSFLSVSCSSFLSSCSQPLNCLQVSQRNFHHF